MKLLFLALTLMTVSCANISNQKQFSEKIGASHSHDANQSKGKILMIVANPAVSKTTGWPIGIWAAELTHPYYEFIKNGYSVDIVSPDGGKVVFDSYSDPRDKSGYSAHDFISMGFIHTPSLMKQLEQTKKLSEVDAKDYKAIFLVGGQSPMYTFRGNEKLMKFVASFYETGKPTALVCHATSILLDTKLSNGKLLVTGKSWTGFADSEEAFADKFVGKKIQPFWIESEAKKIKETTFIAKPAFTPYAIKDGNLITGQQQNSGALAAEFIVKHLSH